MSEQKPEASVKELGDSGTQETSEGQPSSTIQIEDVPPSDSDCPVVSSNFAVGQQQQQQPPSSLPSSSTQPPDAISTTSIVTTNSNPDSSQVMPHSGGTHRHSFNRIELPTFRFMSRGGDRRSSSNSNEGARPSNWRDNLNNVFHEILVQHSRNTNGPLSQLFPDRRNLLLTNANAARGAGPSGSNTPSQMSQTNSVSDSFVINVYEPVTLVPPNANTINQNTNQSETNTPDESSRQLHTHQQHVHHIHLDGNNIPNPVAGAAGPTPPDRNQPSSSNASHANTRSNSISSNQPGNEEANVQEALNQIPEARAMMDTLARYTPLILILITKLAYDHLDGIIHFMALMMTFAHANWVVRQEISKQSQRRFVVLIRELIFIAVALAIIAFILERKNIFLSLIFVPDVEEKLTLKSLLFSVCMTDLVLKLLTIIIKIVITLMPPSVVEYKSRGKIYLMTESLSQLYRSVAPIQPWLIFLFESYSGSEKIVGVILSAAYMVAKSTDLLDRFKFCKRSFIKLLQKTSYGSIPTKEQLQQCGGQCPICHDNFNSPVLLECNHIFCELCVGQWFDREQTCPLCRAKIVDDPSYRDGATTFFLQLY